MRSAAFLTRCTVVALLGGLIGCSSKGGDRNPAEVRLVQIGAAYARATGRLQRAPQNSEELKPDLVGTDVADLFTSPNDGQPFVILWGTDFVKLPPPKTKDDYAVQAYERQGTGGRRYVLRYPSGVVQMTDEELQHAVFPPGHKPPG